MERFGDGAGRHSIDRRNDGFDSGSNLERGRSGGHHSRKSQKPSFEEELEGLYRVNNEEKCRRSSPTNSPTGDKQCNELL